MCTYMFVCITHTCAHGDTRTHMHAVVDGRWKLSSAYRVAHDGLESSGNNIILVTRPPGGAMAGDRPRSREQAHALVSLLTLICGRFADFSEFPAAGRHARYIEAGR